MPMPNVPKLALTRNQVIIAGGVLVLVIGVICLFLFGSGSGQTAVPEKLTFWGIDPKSAFDTAISSYEGVQPNVTITYVQVPAYNYDDSLLNALAAGTGPDVFMITNHDLLKKLSLLAPAQSAQMTPSQ